MCQGSDGHGPEEPPEAMAGLRGRFLDTLRAAGHAPTAQRTAIVEALLATRGHICAEHILEAAGRDHPSPRLNKTTVYRTLDLFLSLGLIQEMKSPDGRAQYELATHPRHYHLHCERCGAVVALDEGVAAGIRGSLARHHGFALDLEKYPLSGLCPSCRSR